MSVARTALFWTHGPCLSRCRTYRERSVFGRWLAVDTSPLSRLRRRTRFDFSQPTAGKDVGLAVLESWTIAASRRHRLSRRRRQNPWCYLRCHSSKIAPMIAVSPLTDTEKPNKSAAAPSLGRSLVSTGSVDAATPRASVNAPQISILPMSRHRVFMQRGEGSRPGALCARRPGEGSQPGPFRARRP